MDNLIKKFAILDIKRIDKFNFTKKILRHRVNNYGIQINVSFNNNINYKELEDFSQTLISNIFQDFKKKNISKNVRNFFEFLEKRI